MAGQLPGLSYLDVYLNDPQYLERKFFPITVVKWENLEPREPEELHCLEQLLQFLDDGARHKIIMLENPTPPVITELGGRLKIDPQFWADFLMGPGWFGSGIRVIGTGKPEVTYYDDSILEQLWPLPTDAGRQSHACFRFVAHREVHASRTGGAKDGILSMRYPIVDHARPGPPHYAKTISTRANIAIWDTGVHERGKNTTRKSWIGIVAIENRGRGIPEGAQGGPYVFRDFSLKSSSGDNIRSGDQYLTGIWENRPQRAVRGNASLRDIYTRHLKTHNTDLKFLNASVIEPSSQFTDVYRLIACLWVTEIESQHLHLSWMESYYHRNVSERKKSFQLLGILFPNPLGGLPAKLEVDLLELHRRRMVAGPYRHLIRELREHCANRIAGTRGFKKPARLKIKGIYRDLCDVLQFLEDSITRLEQRIVMIIDFLRSISDDFETERSSYRNQTLFLLSLWAWLISPVSLLTSILGLGRNTNSNSQKVGDITVFWRALIPVLGGVVIVIVTLLVITEFLNCKARRTNSLIKKRE